MEAEIRRYSFVDKPEILSEFDEIYHHFDNDVEITFQDVFKSNRDDQIRRIDDKYPVLHIANFVYAPGSQNVVNRPVSASRVVNIERGNYAEGIVDKRRNDESVKNKSSNPWSSGSFYLIVFLVIIIALAVIGHILAWYIFPIVIVGGLLALSVAGAFQLRQDNRLSEENFLKLMALSFKYIPWLKGSSTGSLQDTLPESSTSSHKPSK